MEETKTLHTLKEALAKGFVMDDETLGDAIRNGYLGCVKYVHENAPAFFDTEGACPTAVMTENDDVVILEYLHKRGYPINRSTIEGAIMYDNVACLNYIFAMCPLIGLEFPKHICDYAVSQGSMKCLRYLINRGFRINEKTCGKAETLEMLKFLRSFNCSWDERVLKNAEYDCDVDILNYCYDEKCPGYEKYESVINRLAGMDYCQF